MSELELSDPLQYVLDAIDREAVRQAIDQLWPRHRTVLLWRLEDGLTYAEIGARLGISRTRAHDIKNSAENQICKMLGEPLLHPRRR